MELRHLRYFQAVAELGSVTAAARRLYISQSAISEQIKDLEQELGCELLDRSGRKVQLTAQGQVFLEEARRTLEAAQRAIDVTRRSVRGEVGSLAIGYFVWGTAGFFPRIIREFRKSRPGIRLSLVEMHAMRQIEALEAGNIDVALTRPLQPPLDKIFRSELLLRDPAVVAMPPDHRLAHNKEVKTRDLAEERLVLAERRSNTEFFDNIVAVCAAEGFSPQIVNTSATWSGVLTLVEAGEGIALVPSGVKTLRMRGLVFRPFASALSAGLAAVWDPRREGPALMEFLRLVREHRDRSDRGAASFD
ncbi:MAG TPA: LysR substrate-binding domain-containing protein [Candidatus Aquilonibacter sp.]|nr:LysR substrate-binding domain-containing protein [Candidatus Aquilonibacter sp.]